MCRSPLPAKKVYRLTALAFLALLVLAAAGIGVISRGLPSFAQLENYSPELATKVYSADGQLIDEFFAQRRFFTPLKDVPPNLVNAVLAIEDHIFYRHWGMAPTRFFLVSIKYLFTGSKSQGASTLTQQLARRLYLTPEKSITRKLKEIVTAIQLERAYTKDEILEMYINQMQFGYATYGVESAARYFFGKSVQQLSLSECALLAGAVQLPGVYNPYRNYDRTKLRRNLVLRRMLDEGFITPAEFAAATSEEIVLKERYVEAPIDDASYFNEHVRRILYEKYGHDIYESGLRIYTTLDTRAQDADNRAIRDRRTIYQARVNRAFRRPNNFKMICPPSLLKEQSLSQILENHALVDSLINEHCRVQVAFVALDPRNGHILAMVGGRNFEESEFNRATQALRQPGSSFKPILYTAAVDNGLMPFYTKLNQPVTVENVDGAGKRWTPVNFDGSVGGPTTLREALRRSLNLVSVRLIKEDVPPKTVIQYARNLGITAPIEPYDAIALGANGIKPIEMVSAFGVFANKGVHAEPMAILRIEDKYGNVIESFEPKKKGVLREETAYIMANMLQTAASKGTGAMSRSVYHFYHPAGGKTGTTNRYTDAWYINFTPLLAAGTWVGLDDPAMSLGDRQTGAVVALPITASFMRMAVDTLNIPPLPFERPPGIKDIKICTESHQLATEYCPDTLDEICDVRYLPPPCDLHADGKVKTPQQKRRIGL